MTNREKARQLASEALNELTQPGLSLEAPIRKAVRVAALLNHPAKCAWFQLQLLDVGTHLKDVAGIKEMIQANLGDSSTANEVFETVMIDYTGSRTLKSTGHTQLYGAAIGEMEALVTGMTQEIMTASGPAPQEFLTALNEQHGMVQLVRNRLQDYLISIESEEEPQNLGA